MSTGAIEVGRRRRVVGPAHARHSRGARQNEQLQPRNCASSIDIWIPARRVAAQRIVLRRRLCRYSTLPVGRGLKIRPDLTSCT